ncbi:MAG: hypothetical protein ACI81I_000897, partial [Arcobacteraceae bacterium]
MSDDTEKKEKEGEITGWDGSSYIDSSIHINSTGTIQVINSSGDTSITDVSGDISITTVSGHSLKSDSSWPSSITPGMSGDGETSSWGTIAGDTFYSGGGDPYPITETEEKQIKKKKINKYEIKMKKIEEVLTKVYDNESLRKSIVPLFIGNPGLGKTVIIQEFAKKKGVKLVELITSQMSPFEISGIAMPDKELKKMIYYNFDKLENLEDGDILFFDELLNGNPVVLNACLTILEQRKFISGKDLPNILIIAAANPQGMSPLTPQIKERFIWYTVKFDKSMWIEYMIKKYQISKGIGNTLSKLIVDEKFETNNFYSPRSIDKAVNMLIHDVPTPY